MRVPDWHARFWAELERRQNFPFEWGGHETTQDCCTFAAAMIDAITGGDYLARLLTHYHDYDSALAFIDVHGGIDGAISGFLGDPAPLSFAQRGDVVTLSGDIMAGVHLGDRIVGASHEGLVYVSTSDARLRWAI